MTTFGGRGFCEKRAAAALYSGVVVAKSAPTPVRSVYVRVRSTHAAFAERMSGTPNPAACSLRGLRGDGDLHDVLKAHGVFS
jgi:hypothetical protein